jgi:hypothetical protein
VPCEPVCPLHPPLKRCAVRLLLHCTASATLLGLFAVVASAYLCTHCCTFQVYPPANFGSDAPSVILTNQWLLGLLAKPANMLVLTAPFACALCLFTSPFTAFCRLPPERRKIPLATISARTKLDIDGTEFLLMRAMSLKLITGTIDEIESVVDIRHVQPRVLTPAEITGLKAHVESWMAKVDGASSMLEAEGVSAIEAVV